MDLKQELSRINAELQELEDERMLLQKVRDAKMRRLVAKMQNVPERFAQQHPVLAEAATLAKQGAAGVGGALKQIGQEIAPELKKAGQFLYDNQQRYNMNQQFANTLQPGQTAFNPATNSNVTKNADGTFTASRMRTPLPTVRPQRKQEVIV